MIIRFGRFNIYFVLGLGLALLCGCHSTGEHKGQLSTLRLHQEMNYDAMGRSENIQVFRNSPISFTVEKAAFLTEARIKSAKVIDVLGGFAIEIQFDREGSWLLEQYTATIRGKHITVFSQFATPPDTKLNQGRWLAAPLIRTHITDGKLVFTPDATRQEADQIVLGLTHVAKKTQSGEE